MRFEGLEIRYLGSCKVRSDKSLIEVSIQNSNPLGSKERPVKVRVI